MRKGTNLSALDSETGEQVEIFNPRTMQWQDHFFVRDGYIVGSTACGRATVRLLDMNNDHRLQLRRKLIEQHEFSLD